MNENTPHFRGLGTGPTEVFMNAREQLYKNELINCFNQVPTLLDFETSDRLYAKATLYESY